MPGQRGEPANSLGRRAELGIALFPERDGRGHVTEIQVGRGKRTDGDLHCRCDNLAATIRLGPYGVGEFAAGS